MVLIASVASFVVGWFMRGVRDRCKAHSIRNKVAEISTKVEEGRKKVQDAVDKYK